MCYAQPTPFQPRITIWDLPEEIHILIFRFCMQNRYHDLNLVGRNRDRDIQAAVELVKLSHVCSAWRGILLCNRRFWTRVDMRNGDRLRAFVERSGTLPLSLFISCNVTGVPTMRNIVASERDRIRRLDIVVHDTDLEIYDELGDFEFAAGAPLECLAITYENLNMHFHHDSDFFLLGRKILPMVALAIVPLSGRFPATHFPNLTYLYLGTTLKFGRDRLPVKLSWSLLDLLHNTPKLEFLSLLGIGDGGRGLANDRSPALKLPVPLNRLRSLVFTDGDLATISTVLQHLSMPETALVRIHQVDAARSQVLPTLPRLSALRSIDRLSLTTEQTHLQMVAEGASSGLWLQGRILKFRRHRDEDDDIVTWNWTVWLSKLPTFLPLGQVTCLDIYVGMHHGIVPNLLQHMVGLEEFSIRLRHQDERLGGSPELSLVRIVYRLLTQEDPLLCPNLRVLNIDVDGAYGNTTPDLYPDDLRTMVMCRVRIGHPIRTIRIQPFADQNIADPNWFGSIDIAERLDKLKADVDCVKLLRPGHPTIRYECARWAKWHIDGAERYWNREMEEIEYVTPWNEEEESYP